MSAPPPALTKGPTGCCRFAIEAAVVLTVSLEVTAWVPDMAAGADTAHVGGLAAPGGRPVTAHESDTLPLKPPTGVIVIVEVVEPPAEIAGAASPARVKDG
jgi:hypothetical protein